jgi:hypothetical protein
MPEAVITQTESLLKLQTGGTSWTPATITGFSDIQGIDFINNTTGYIMLSAGTYEADFNASKLSSGIYFYRIIAAGYSETKKMMLVK